MGVNRQAVATWCTIEEDDGGWWRHDTWRGGAPWHLGGGGVHVYSLPDRMSTWRRPQVPWQWTSTYVLITGSKEDDPGGVLLDDVDCRRGSGWPDPEAHVSGMARSDGKDHLNGACWHVSQGLSRIWYQQGRRRQGGASADLAAAFTSSPAMRFGWDGGKASSAVHHGAVSRRI